MRMPVDRLARILFVGCSLLVTGCVASDAGKGVSSTTTVTTQTPQQIAPAQETPTPEIAALPPEPEPEPEPLMPVPELQSLIGYSAAQLQDLLGTPSFLRSDPPSALWQYRNAHCTIDLFLYDGGNGRYSVDHLAFREPTISTETLEACLRDIITRTLAAQAAAN